MLMTSVGKGVGVKAGRGGATGGVIGARRQSTVDKQINRNAGQIIIEITELPQRPGQRRKHRAMEIGDEQQHRNRQQHQQRRQDARPISGHTRQGVFRILGNAAK